MGSFNVACSISNLSISPGTPTVLIPLFPSHVHFGKPHVIETAPMLIYPNDYYNPLTLPIFGAYDDYGSLEDIVEDDNTRAISQHFGVSIQDFVALITCGRKDVNDQFSEVFRVFAKDQKLLTDYSIRFDADFLLRLGFVREESGDYRHEDSTFRVRLTKRDDFTDHGYQILNAADQVVFDRDGYTSVDRYFLNDYASATNHLLNVSEEQQGVVKSFLRMSGMFVHGRIYEELARDPQPEFEEHYDALQKQIELYDAENAPKENKLQAIRHEMHNDPFSYLQWQRNPFLSFFREWENFAGVYQKALRAGQLKEAAVRYYSFYINMYSMNRFFFPAMNGRQEGDPQASKRLIEASLVLVNEELKKQEEW